MPLSREQLYAALVDSGGLEAKVFKLVEDLRDSSKQGIDGTIVAKGYLKDEEVGQLIADYLEVPFVNLRQQAIPEEVLALIPEAFARSQKLIPVSRKGEVVRIASADPKNVQLEALLEKYLRQEVVLSYATPRDIEANLSLFQQDPGVALQKIVESAGPNPEEDTTVIDLVNGIIDFAYQHRASDIHIEPEDIYTVIRYRTDGVLYDITDLPKKYHELIITRLKVVAKLATDEHRAAQDGKISHQSAWGDGIEIRLSIVPTTNGEKAVMRLLSEKAREYSLSDLGLSEADIGKFSEAIEKPWGMILVTGPTGSGKTTSLYAALKVLNTRDVNISSIEDPVEYDIEGVNQIQVNTKTNLTFAKGLRSIVRQDPDIIMVGEVRDSETADISINAALTGHLVLSTLHTNDSASTFPRLKDMGVESFLIASTVVSIIAQRLVRKICLRCIHSTTIDDKTKKLLDHYPQIKKYILQISRKKTLSGVRIFKGSGCPICNHTGYTGRTGLFEILTVSDGIRDAVMADKNSDEIREIAVQEGMTTMLYDGVAKALTGATTLEEILRATQEG
jgi:type IV pilus assembly protein PilB